MLEIISIERSDDIGHVALKGRLMAGSIQDIDVRFHKATAAKERNTIVDLTELEIITSLGIGMIIGCSRSLERNGHKLVVLNPQDSVDKAMKTLRVAEVLPVVYSLDEAVAIVKS